MAAVRKAVEEMSGKFAEAFNLSGFMQMGGKGLTLTPVDVGGSGNTAYVIGKYSFTRQPKGQEIMTDSGQYVEIWKRQDDGS